MENHTLYKLLRQRPGFEVVHLLLLSDQYREDIATYVDTDGGTLQRWIDAAESAGLISLRFEREKNGPALIVSLDTQLNDSCKEIIHSRGGAGPRGENRNHADVPNYDKWMDNYSLTDALKS